MYHTAVHIYAGVAASLAERKRGSQLTEFFRNIKGTIDDDDWDQVFITFSFSLLLERGLFLFLFLLFFDKRRMLLRREK